MRAKRVGKDNDVVTVGRIAKALGVSRSTAYIRARSGDLPVRWRGGRFEMTRRALDRLVAEQAQPTELARAS